MCPVSKSGDFEEVADRVLVHRQAILDVERFEAGPGTVINAHARGFGTAVHIGRKGGSMSTRPSAAEARMTPGHI